MIPFKILIVEDNPILRRAIRECLIIFKDFIVAGECTDGDEVLDFLSFNSIDVILMDISMKRMSGMEATKMG